MKIFKMDEFWAALVMIALLIVNELANIPFEMLIMVAGAVAAWLGKAGLDSWKRRVKAGKEQFEATQNKLAANLKSVAADKKRK